MHTPPPVGMMYSATRLVVFTLGCTCIGTPAFSQPRNLTPTEVRAIEDAARRAEESARKAEQERVAVATLRTQLQTQSAQVLQEVKAASADALNRAEWLDKMSTGAISLAGFAAVVIAGLAGYETLSIRRKLRERERELRQQITAMKTHVEGAGKSAAEARDAATGIQAIQQDLKEHALFLGKLADQCKAAVLEIEARVSPTLAAGDTLLGLESSAQDTQRAYDDDALLSLSDRLKITGLDEPALAAVLVKLAQYWRRTGDYARALERLRRATKLDPESALAHLNLGRALWNKVGGELSRQGEKVAKLESQLRELHEADQELRKAEELFRANNAEYEEIYFDLATIRRFRGEFDAATDLYRKGADRSKARAAFERHEPDWDFEYSLACLAASRGAFSQALAVLEPLADKSRRWDQGRGYEVPCDYRAWTESDPDFVEMRRHAEWGPRLEKWVRKA